MSAVPSHALVPYLGHGDDGATAWSRLAPGERRRTAMQAAREHDAATLWSLTEAWLRTFGAAGARVSAGTVRTYRCGVSTLLAAWTTQDLLRPDAATLYVRQLDMCGSWSAGASPPPPSRRGSRPGAVCTRPCAGVVP